MRRKIVIGVAVLAVAAFAGGAFAATQERLERAPGLLSDVCSGCTGARRTARSDQGRAYRPANRRWRRSSSAAQASKMKTMIRAWRDDAVPRAAGRAPRRSRGTSRPCRARQRAFKPPRGAQAVPGGIGPPRARPLVARARVRVRRGSCIGAGRIPRREPGAAGQGPSVRQDARADRERARQVAAGRKHVIVASRKATLDKLVAAKLMTRCPPRSGCAVRKALTTLLSTKHRRRLCFGRAWHSGSARRAGSFPDTG